MRLDRNVNTKVSISGEGIAPLLEFLNLQKDQNLQLSKDLLIHRTQDGADFTATWLTVAKGFASTKTESKTTSHVVQSYNVNITVDAKYADIAAKLPKHFMILSPQNLIHVNLLRLGKVGTPEISVQIKMDGREEIDGEIE